MTKNLRKTFRNPSTRIVVFAVLFAVFGTVAILLAQAATTSTAGTEAEGGLVAGNATRVTNDPSVSGNGFVRFGTVQSNAPYETINIPDYGSAYPIPDPNHPADIKYVATNGSDTNPGTLAAPYRTVGKGVSAVANNGTVVVRGGIYREKIGTISKSITIQAYNKEKPWLDGSDVVSGWVADSNGTSTIWRHDNWNAQLCQTCIGSNGAVIDPAYPYAGLPDMVFATSNGSLDVQKYFTQVTSKSAVGPSKFYVDYANAKLYIGDNPSNLNIEATARDQAFFSNVSNFRLLGMGIRKYGSITNPSLPPSAGARFNAAGGYAENSAFTWNASDGLMTAAGGNTIKNSVMAFNGLLGLRMNNGNGSTITGSRFAYSNFEHFIVSGGAATAAGAKITNTNGVTVTDNTFDNNYSNALWFDLGVKNGVAVRNIVKDNDATGVYYEVSDGGIIASNRITGSCRLTAKTYCSGIKVSSSSDTSVYNNTVIGGWSGIGIYYDGRKPLFGVSIVNNVVADTSGSAPMIHAQETAAGSPIFGSPAWFTTVNGNVYRRSAPGVPTNLLSFDSKTNTDFNYRCIVSGCSPAAQPAWEGNGNEPAAGSQIFVNQSAGNLTLSTVFVGVPLPANIANAVGVSSGGTNVGYLR